jgi:hypothetical protein
VRVTNSLVYRVLVEWATLSESDSLEKEKKYEKRLAFEKEVQTSLRKPTYLIKCDGGKAVMTRFKGGDCEKLLKHASMTKLDSSEDTCTVFEVIRVLQYHSNPYKTLRKITAFDQNPKVPTNAELRQYQVLCSGFGKILEKRFVKGKPTGE